MPEFLQRALRALAVWRGEARRARRAAAIAEMPRRTRGELHSLYLSSPSFDLPSRRPEARSALDRGARPEGRARRLGARDTAVVAIGAVVVVAIVLTA